jgi:RNase P/RNase MRP subunit p29
MMEELIGLNVKLFLNNTSGFITIKGRVVNVFDHFILLETDMGPQYFSVYHIKRIIVLGENDEK